MNERVEAGDHQHKIERVKVVRVTEAHNAETECAHEHEKQRGQIEVLAVHEPEPLVVLMLLVHLGHGHHLNKLFCVILYKL